ncbi:hypothetical protein PoB_007683200 [Plakobranchus ocellatus]|uniref:Uncharacterized protein n=1 Tax=Plakobranchus ocellatus TaxID=259542 RepID=A0AAV4E160_9GAST|nr:hypothetical protein PoB_007683200 [Plakobranchus ocellatus]
MASLKRISFDTNGTPRGWGLTPVEPIYLGGKISPTLPKHGPLKEPKFKRAASTSPRNTARPKKPSGCFFNKGIRLVDIYDVEKEGRCAGKLQIASFLNDMTSIGAKLKRHLNIAQLTA